MTKSELQSRRESHGLTLFDRGVMKFFGDTMANYALCGGRDAHTGQGPVLGASPEESGEVWPYRLRVLRREDASPWSFLTSRHKQ